MLSALQQKIFKTFKDTMYFIRELTQVITSTYIILVTRVRKSGLDTAR